MPIAANNSLKDHKANRACSVVTTYGDVVIIGGFNEIDGKSMKTVKKLDTITM